MIQSSFDKQRKISHMFVTAIAFNLGEDDTTPGLYTTMRVLTTGKERYCIVYDYLADIGILTRLPCYPGSLTEYRLCDTIFNVKY